MKKTNIIKMITIISVMVAVIATVLPVSAYAADNSISREMYLKLSGVLDEPCEIITYSHGMPEGKIQEIKIKKRVDKYTPRIVQAAESGEKIAYGETIYIAGGSKCRSTFKDAIIVQDYFAVEYIEDDYQDVVEYIVIRAKYDRMIVE